MRIKNDRVEGSQERFGKLRRDGDGKGEDSTSQIEKECERARDEHDSIAEARLPGFRESSRNLWKQMEELCFSAFPPCLWPILVDACPRISEKAKATPPPEGEPPKKRSRKSTSAKKEDKEKEAAPEGAKETKSSDVQDAEKAEKDADTEMEKVDVKENQDVEKTPAPSEEAKVQQEANVPGDALALGDSTASIDGKEVEGEKEEKVEQPPVGVGKDEVTGYQGKAGIAIADGDKHEGEVEEKGNDEEHNSSGVHKAGKKVEENGSPGN